MPIKDALERLMKIFHRDGPKCVKDPSHFDAIIGVGVTAIPGRHQQTVITLTELMEFRRVVMAITQDEADFGRNFA
jgi:hypothetical protein